MKWEPVIGLECHVQLATTSKLFSPSAASFGAPPNSLTDPTVLALPGALPVMNGRVLELALRLGLATRSEIRRRSRFARKHYFYPDLPKGYQISQYDEPLCERGVVDFLLGGEARQVRLTRIHIEEDAGKSIHAEGMSLVDLNRAGVPLVEVVSEPDMHSADEAAEFMRALRQLVRWLDISDGNMEEGSLRCDANVSIRPAGETRLGTKAELKNINSFKFVHKAIEHEIARQIAVVEAGHKVVQETRLWDAERGTSAPMRTKEHAHDYRYFPDPDLPPLAVSEEQLDAVRVAMPELPLARRARFVSGYGLSDADARFLTEERSLADHFEAAARAHGDAKKVANWVMQKEATSVPPEALAELVRLIDDGTVSGKIAKDVLHKMVATGETAAAIVEREGLRQVTDASAIEAAVRAVIDQNPKQVAQYRAGKETMLGFFVGQVMKATAGKANPQAVNEILRKLLGESS